MSKDKGHVSRHGLNIFIHLSVILIHFLIFFEYMIVTIYITTRNEYGLGEECAVQKSLLPDLKQFSAQHGNRLSANMHAIPI